MDASKKERECMCLWVEREQKINYVTLYYEQNETENALWKTDSAGWSQYPFMMHMAEQREH